mgnify:CR=1 FL=1
MPTKLQRRLFVFIALLMGTPDLARLQRDQKAHRWERYCGGELAGRTLAIIGAGVPFVTKPTAEPMRMVDLLRHTSGLTYSFQNRSNVDAAYRAGKIENWYGNLTLDEFIAALGKLPLEFSPGEAWNYSVSTDVLGAAVERVAGMPLDRMFEERIFAPLKMQDTAFWAPEAKHGRMAALYLADTTTMKARRGQTLEQNALRKPTYFSGGGGLVSTAYDYWRFLQMLENGGELDGARIISPTTLDLMTMNHLPNNTDISSWGRPLGDEIFYNGLGFGLGFAVVIDQAKTKVACPNGTYSWGGMASTAFWVDPVEEGTAMFFTQLVPSTTHPIRPYLRSLVYQSIID